MFKDSRILVLCAATAAVLGISGCGINGSGSSIGAATGVGQSLQMSGTVYGGSQPVNGAYVQLYAVGSGGYGTGAVPLISTAATTDGSVQSTLQTDSSGAFSLAGKFSCPSGNPNVYITAVGGDPGAGTNKQSAFMAALGPCTTSLTSTTHISMNEVTTVGAIWALQGFIGYTATGTTASLYWNGGSNDGAGTTTPATGFAVGSSSTNTVGLGNAFGIASVLANTTTGSSPGTNTSGNITSVEYGTVNLLANILSYCVNSNGGTAGDMSNCGNLFAAVTPTGGTAPQDTLQAAYLIARNPANNVTGITNLAPPTAFSPAASSFNDFTVAFNVGNANSNASYNTTFASPYGVAFDSFGNAWVYNLDGSGTGGTNGLTATAPYAPFITELDPTGNLLTKITQYKNSAGSLTTINSQGVNFPLSNSHPAHLVIDSANNVYAEDHQSGYLFAIQPSTGAGVASPGVSTVDAIPTGVAASSGTSWGSGIQNLALDGQGSLWFNTGVAGASPFNTTSGYIEALATSSFTTGTAASVTTGSFVGSNNYGLAIDNTPTSVNGAPFVWGSNISNCVGATTGATLGSTSAYGDIFPVYGVSGGTATRGSQAAFKAVTDNGVATTGTGSCSTTSYPTQLATVTTSYSGTSYSAAPIAEPIALSFDASNNLWIVNQYDAAATSGTGAGQFGTVPNLSVTHMKLSETTSALTITNVAQSTGGGINAAAAVGGASSTTSLELQGAIDGAGNFWVGSGAGAYVAEYSYNSTSGIVPLSPSTGFIGSTCSGCLASVGTTARKSGTRKAVSVDRSGNVWSPNASSSGNWITVIVGAATPTATPALPSTQGTLP